MKYDRTESFKGDYRKLTDPERALFRKAVQDINEVVRNHKGAGLPPWPTHLRMKRVQGAVGIFEMTWSFAGPDGRATFEVLTEDGEPIMVWRRIGGHAIFRKP